LKDGSLYNHIDGGHSHFPLGRRKVGVIASSGAPFHVRDVRPDMDWLSDPQWIRDEEIHSFVGQPIIHKKEVLGVFSVFSRGRHGQYVVERMRMVADYLAVVIANTRAFEDLEKLKRRLEIENDYLRQSLSVQQCLPGLVGRSPALEYIREQIMQVARTDAVVLITGESGTGKELVAEEVHRQSGVADGPLIKVNCPSIPAELFESEFFGHARGAFTGAVASRMGYFEAANNGTLFLDEIGELPLQLQSKLLRVLQEHEYHRVGEDRSRTLRTRVVAATNRNLARMVREGRFRQDLYYRLNVFPIETPPLRARREDIPLLASFFLERCARDLQRPGLELTKAQMDCLQKYDWPGNIRELQNVIRRGAIMGRGRSVNLDFMRRQLDEQELYETARTDRAPAPGYPQSPAYAPAPDYAGPAGFGAAPVRMPDRMPEREPAPAADRMPAQAGAPEGRRRILTEKEMREFEKENLVQALTASNGRIYGDRGAAAMLGIKPTTLVSRIAKLGLGRDQRDS
ncbi:MAG: sigma 54-interacting transcriptional regulator, partial [Desulfovibrionaceae bacterium]|nr:sigma 54-interacting transcriptional regulator [Desulfovibrionaceae bacterium]